MASLNIYFRRVQLEVERYIQNVFLEGFLDFSVVHVPKKNTQFFRLPSIAYTELQ
jgi:hypothetical protein